MSKEIGFSVHQREVGTQLINSTDLYLEISLVPIKPKRAYRAIMLIAPHSFQIIDGKEFDLSKVCFRIMFTKEVVNDATDYSNE